MVGGKDGFTAPWADLLFLLRGIAGEIPIKVTKVLHLQLDHILREGACTWNQRGAWTLLDGFVHHKRWSRLLHTPARTPPDSLLSSPISIALKPPITET